MIQRTQYLNKVEKYIDKDFIKVITGVRRCGKTTLLKQIIEKLEKRGIKSDNIIYINLEFEKYISVNTHEQLSEIINDLTKDITGRTYLFIDEIQIVEGWERLINAYFAEKRFDIYITGSNSKLLSGELATYLTGRYVEIKLYPFSFNEFIEYKKKDLDEFNYEKLFNEYITTGGMPNLLSIPLEDRTQQINDLYNSILLKDIVQRNSIRDIDLLKRIMHFIIQNIGQLVSVKNIVNYLKKDNVNVSVNTIYNYLNYFMDSCLIHKVNREKLIGKKILNYSEKYYLVDLGFRNVLNYNNLEDIDQSLENIIYNELLCRDYNVTIGIYKNSEIDFVCRKNNKIIYIQVSYILATKKTLEREFKPLIEIKDNYPKYVLSMDKINMSHKGIEHVNIIDFLLNDTIN